MRRLKFLLVASMAAGALGFVAVPKVWALFTAEAGQLPASATSGTLVMNLTVNGNSCFSYNGPASPGNLNSGCSALYTYAPANELYPGVPVTVNVTVKDAGTLDASDIRLYMPGGCTVSQTGDAPSAGGASPCAAGGMQVYVQETATLGGPPTKCWLPAGGTTCSFTTNLSTLATATTAANGLDLGAGPTSGGSRFFTIGIQLPSTASNAYQGEAASFVLAWHMRS